MDSTNIILQTERIGGKPISQVFNMDCVEGMKQIPDNFFCLAITDPPYGIGEDGRNNHTRSKLAKAKDYRSNSRYDNATPEGQYFDELRRVSKNQIIWGGNYFIKHLDNTPCLVVWDKDNGESDFADCEIAWTSFPTAVRKVRYKWAGMLQQDMKNKEERLHPNQKPVSLYQWLLTTYAQPGQRILDTHMGSQSSRIAAYLMGFDYYGWEIDAEYFEQGNKRFDLVTSQQQLF